MKRTRIPSGINAKQSRTPEQFRRIVRFHSVGGSLKHFRRNHSFLTLIEMRTTKQFLLTALAICALSACGKKDTPEPEPKPTPGTEQPVRPARLRGFMVARVEDVSKRTLDDVAAWGANIIRLQICPVAYATKNNSNIWQALPVYLIRIDELLKLAKARGLKVVLDLHEPPVNDYTNPSFPAFWNKSQILDDFLRFWTAVANKFKAPAYNDLIYGYDIYNEPAAWVRGTDHVPPQVARPGPRDRQGHSRHRSRRLDHLRARPLERPGQLPQPEAPRRQTRDV